MDSIFSPIVPDNAETLKCITLQGIPFTVIPQQQGCRNLTPGSYPVKKTFDKVYLLGMTTENPEGCEWWGPSARWYDNRPRVFIGDRLGAVNIYYSDNTTDAIPIIFGVNCWFYELFSQRKQGEDHLNIYGGPYPEPFQSDATAQKLLTDSLLLTPNDEEKGLKYIFGIKTKHNEIESIGIKRYDYRSAGFVVTAMTGASPDLSDDRTAYDADFFLRQEYYPEMDRLARRLYQFRDEIPSKVPLDLPEDYEGPRVRFTGNNYAEIFTNMYAHNILDMAVDKVDAEGMTHTSSKHAPNFGLYVGFGTYADDVGSYYSHIWTRDVGRSIIEVVGWGKRERFVRAGDKALHYLYDENARYTQPNWKRIANASELNNRQSLEFASTKENDGHGSMMLFLYRLYQLQCVDEEWIRERWQSFVDAAEWFGWQMENPETSGFDKVLSSESEASDQKFGMPDLFSNTMAYYALKAYGRIAKNIGENARSERWNELADKLWDGIMTLFTAKHPRYGRIFVDNNYGGWTWEYKRFAPLFLNPDFATYDVAKDNPELFTICQNTYYAQKEDFFSYDAGRQMAYGQGYITQAAILLDDSQDMRGYLEQAAAFCYHHTDHPWVVPEGVINHPSNRFWFRNGDLGNSVQQAEIVKCARLLIGLDDLNPERGLMIVPRLPEGWESIEVSDYPVIGMVNGQLKREKLDYVYKRIDNGYSVEINAADPMDLLSIRIGPFPEAANHINVECATAYERENLTVGRSVFVYITLKNAISAAVVIAAAKGLPCEHD